MDLMRRAWRGLALLGVLALSTASTHAADLEVFPLHSQASVAILHGRHLYIEVYSGRIETYLRPGDRQPAPASAPARIEWERLNGAVQAMALRRLFPQDTISAGSWNHRVTYAGGPRGGEGLAEIAAWFTGDRRRAAELATWNQISETPRNGALVRIPRAALLPALAKLVPEPARAARLLRPSPDAPRALVEVPASDLRLPRGPLSYGADALGQFAVYRLQPGEVLYSDVVVRFTGRVDVYDVTEAAEIIQKRSGIADPRGLASGTPIKIPIELLEPEYLPQTDPRHKQFLADRTETDRYRSRATARSLEGVVLVLDPGHGGVDPGAIGVCGVCEDEAVYDVAMRVARIAGSETQAKVLLTLRDRLHGAGVRDATHLPRDDSEEVLTHPTYAATDTRISAHLRWYLANSWLRKLQARGTDPGKIVFASFHADARHPSAPGMMVYVPDAVHSGGSIEKTSSAYRRFAEVREQPGVSFTRSERVRSEAVSRDFAEVLIAAMNRAGVGVHSDVPIRGSINRRRKRYVPAVLRYNAIPIKVLVEVANLNNRRACESMRDPSWREKVARAYVNALVDYFGAHEASAALVEVPSARSLVD
jgi:N-acetylmuramoyl-L-alanine amidase